MTETAAVLPDSQRQLKKDVSSPDGGIVRISMDGKAPSYSHILTNYINKNRPFILTPGACVGEDGKRWAVFDDWLKPEYDETTGHLDVDYICDRYGDDEVPVARCNEEAHGSHPRSRMTFREYLDYLKDPKSARGSLYLKDYHFVRLHGDDNLYKTPVYFSSDWLNEYCHDKDIDDYRFVYIGSKGTWTPFHADVLRSFSWSANISGTKRWIFYPAGKEQLLADKLNNLPFDVTRQPYSSPDHPSYKYRMEVVQNAGEVIFVPSGWHHQVHNLETTLSINHNWFNGSNITLCWKFLQDTLTAVQKEISDCREMEDWHGHCQVLLRAYLAINYQDLYNILRHIAEKRMKGSSAAADADDLLPISVVMQQMAEDEHARRCIGEGLGYLLTQVQEHLSLNTD